MKWVYHASRLVFGGWWLFSGLMHFLWPWLQPLGDEPAAIAFTEALMASGLFDWIKALEVILGATMLLNRAMPLTIVALVPLNVVIVYWNFVLDTGAVEWTFGALSILFNVVLAWPWRHYFFSLMVWKGRADYTTSDSPPNPDPPPFPRHPREGGNHEGGGGWWSGARYQVAAGTRPSRSISVA